MDIHVISGKGEGHTLLSAFDAALKNCGTHNYNLIYLSSIIPPGSHVIQTDRFPAQADQYGYKMYAVKAEERSDNIDTVIGAGIGWYQFDDARGVFVEHHIEARGKDHAKEILESRILQSIQDLCAFREVPFTQEKMHSTLSIATVQHKPACVLVLAVYKTEDWATKQPSPFSQ